MNEPSRKQPLRRAAPNRPDGPGPTAPLAMGRTGEPLRCRTSRATMEP